MESNAPEKLTREEAIARTVHCSTCNAPPTVPCQRIVWRKIPDGWEAGIDSRELAHGHRLKDARKVADRKERIDNAH